MEATGGRVRLASRTSGFSIWKNIRSIHGEVAHDGEQVGTMGLEGGWSAAKSNRGVLPGKLPSIISGHVPAWHVPSSMCFGSCDTLRPHGTPYLRGHSRTGKTSQLLLQ